jgi:hypothetical protein
MNWLKRGFKNAFAVESGGPVEPTAGQREVVDRICREVIRRRMTTPALMFLEMSRPLNYVASQTMHFFHPLVSAVLDTNGYEQFAKFLEHRGSVDYLCRRIEQLEYEQLHSSGSGEARQDA